MKTGLLAEWEPQSAILLVWPHEDTDWKDNLDEIETVYLELSHHITRFQNLLIVCKNEAHCIQVEKRLIQNHIQNSSFQTVICDYNDTWCRDYGPLFVYENSTVVIKNLAFNGWGNRYRYDSDNALAKTLHFKNIFGDINFNDYDFVLEGGSLDSNGQGTILTTSRCLLNRHPDKNQTELEKLLKDTLNIKTLHWIDHGDICGDDTDGHIDMLARFIYDDTIIYSICNDMEYPGYDTLKSMEKQLMQLKKNNDDTYRLIPLALPETKKDGDKLLPASYINFLIINGAVLVPTYNDPMDKVALNTFKQCFHDREVIGINCLPLTKLGGSLHCATMNIPKVIIRNE